MEPSEDSENEENYPICFRKREYKENIEGLSSPQGSWRMKERVNIVAKHRP